MAKFSLPIASKQPEAAAPKTSAHKTRAEGGTIKSEIASIVTDNPVVLFMKGSPNMPQCGFSAKAVSILQSFSVPLFHVNVLADAEIRQGIKDFSDWPTIPQVYVGGEFLGGSDILLEMYQNGELEQAIGDLG